MSTETKYRYYRARAIAEGMNPNIPKTHGFMPIQTGILPPSRNGAASVTTTPRDPGQVARLQRYLYSKARQQYTGTLQREAAKYGIEVAGQITDPAVEQALQDRATFAAQSISNTAANDLASGAEKGVSASDVIAGRETWKPDQIWTTELNTANGRATRDFYANHPNLSPKGHVEPTDAAEDNCQSWIDMGTQPLDTFPDFPIHVGCPHGLSVDSPSDDQTLVPAGTPVSSSNLGFPQDFALQLQPSAFDDGAEVTGDVPVASATADLLNRIGFWLAGLRIVAAKGDKKNDQQSDDTPVLTESDHGYRPSIALDLDNCAFMYPDKLVPLATAVASIGGRVGVLTGNRSPQAQRHWIDLGYPKPDFFVVHQHNHNQHHIISQWKAAQCKALGVDVLIDDFQQGQGDDAFARVADALGLRVLEKPGTPAQRWAESLIEAEEIDRAVAKYDVPPAALFPLIAVMVGNLGPDPYDPRFAGQNIESRYIDTESSALAAARKAGAFYCTLRVRTYPTGTAILEAKTEEAKYRSDPLTEDDARRALNAQDIPALVAEYLPDVAERLAVLTSGNPLSIVSAVLYTRYARETAGTRMTLDMCMHTTDGREYPSPIVECKREGKGPNLPDMSEVGLRPMETSKFLWSVS